MLVELGIQAQHLLTSETFGNAVNALSEQLTNAILSTKLEEQQARERFYMMHSCLNELVGILKSRVATKDNIEIRINDENPNEG